MTTASQLLDKKGHAVYEISPDASVFDAIKEMADKGIGALLVMERDDLIGIMSERDYTRKIALEGRSSRDTPVRDIMSTEVVYARPQQTVEDCVALMTQRRIRHLPVADRGNVVGVLSMRDLAQSMIDEREYLINRLETYITGGR